MEPELNFLFFGKRKTQSRENEDYLSITLIQKLDFNLFGTVSMFRGKIINDIQ